jgi:alpha-tubulin suppressor-like RCC1 family protein
MLVRYLLGLDYDRSLQKDIRSKRDPVAIQYVAAGEDFTAAIDETGRVWTWGRNDYGNLGVGDNKHRHFPTVVSTLSDKDQNIVEVNCGAKHMIAISSEGTAWTWGHGEDGKLGLGHTYDTFEPTNVQGLSRSYIVSASGGSSHTAAVDDSGNLFTWGNGSFGRLGHSNEVSHGEPEMVMYFKRYCDHSGGTPFITQVACGSMHTLVVTNLGKLYSFGGGMYGKLGLGDEKNRLEPSPCLFLQNEKVMQISTAMFHSVALTASGNAFAFGFGGTLNSRFGLGKYTVGDKSTFEVPETNVISKPTKISNWPAVALQMVRSAEDINEVSYALTFTGENRDAEIDDGKKEAVDTNFGAFGALTAAEMIMLEAKITSHTVIKVATGKHHTLLLTYYGSMYAFGENEYGQLGLGHHHDQRSPQKITLGVEDARIRNIACGGHHCLATTSRGMAFAWGASTAGQLGTGRTIGSEDRPTPLESTMSWRFNDIVCGEENSAAITSTGILLTWGLNDLGQLGIGKLIENYPTPAKVIGEIEDMTVKKVSLGLSHSACVTIDGALYSWGNGWYGKLGHGQNMSYREPRLVQYFAEENIVDVSCGAYHTLALTAQGSVYAFGKGDCRLGHGIIEENVNEPRQISSLWVQNVKIVSVCAGESHSLAISEDGSVYSWGNGQFGKLGNATTTEIECKIYQDIQEPQVVKLNDGSRLELGHIFQGRNMPDLRQVSCFSNHSVAVSLIGTVYSWGAGGSGRLGHNDHASRSYPCVLQKFNTMDRDSGQKDGAAGSSGKRNDEELQTSAGRGGRNNAVSNGRDDRQFTGSKNGPVPTEFLADLKSYIRDFKTAQKTPSLYAFYRLSVREPKFLAMKTLRELETKMKMVETILEQQLQEAYSLGNECDALYNDLQVVLVSTLSKMYPAGKVSAVKSRTRKLKARHKEGDSHFPESISSTLGAFSQIFGMMLAHPCYLLILYDRVFGVNSDTPHQDGENSAEDESISSPTSPEAQILQKRLSPVEMIKDHDKVYISVVKSVYGDISSSRHLGLFLLFTQQLLKRNISSTFAAYGRLQFEDLMSRFFNRDSIIVHLFKHLFEANNDHANGLKTNMAKCITYVANISNYVDVDPVQVAISQRLISEKQTKKMSKGELENLRQKFFTETNIRNEVNDRARSLNGAIRTFLQGVQSTIQDLPFGARWLLVSTFEGVRSTLLNFKDSIVDIPKTDLGLNSAVAFLICRLFIKECIAPFVMDAKAFGILPPGATVNRSFKDNLQVLCHLSVKLFCHEGVPEGPWYDGFRANMKAMQDMISGAVLTTTTSTPMEKLQKMLSMDLYREKIRESSLVYTVKLSILQYLRWVINHVGENSLFESTSVKKSSLGVKGPPDNQVHNDPVRLLMAENIWGKDGLMAADGALTENQAFENAQGVLPPAKRNLAINIIIATDWSPGTNIAQSIGNSRRCNTCGATLPAMLSPANAAPIRKTEQYEVDIPFVISHSKMLLRDMLRSGQVPPEIGDNRQLVALKHFQKYLDEQAKRALNHSLYMDVTNISLVQELVTLLQSDVGKVSEVVGELLVELNLRCRAYQKIYVYQVEVSRIMAEIKKYRQTKIKTKRGFMTYLHAMKHGQSEQQNRMVIAMDARSQVSKCSVAGISCFKRGELTNPHLVEGINDHIRPDATAKKLGTRSMVGLVTRTFSYKELKRRGVIHNYQLGVADGTSQKPIAGDSMSVSEASESITDLEQDPTDGSKIVPGVSMSKLKSKLMYKFMQRSSVDYNVYEIYDRVVIIEQFVLNMEEISAIGRRGITTYRPLGSNTTFDTALLFKAVAEIQMRKVLII